MIIGCFVSGSMDRIARLLVNFDQPESLVGDVSLQAVNDLFLDFGKRQAGDMDISIEIRG